LALVGLAGAREGVPGMVLFRPVLGIRGSYLPSVLNIVQLVGWTGFEFWAMSLVANEISKRLFGFSSYGLWLAAVALLCTALALVGPVLGAGLSDKSPAGLGQAIASLAGGWVVLLALLVGESDEAFADIYSSAVSSQNLGPRIRQRWAIVAVAAAGATLAAWLGLRRG